MSTTVYDLYVNRDYVRSFRTRRGVKRAYTNALNAGAIDVAWNAVTDDGWDRAYSRDWPQFLGCKMVPRIFS